MLTWGHVGGDRRKGRLVPSQLLSRACPWEKNQGQEDKGWMGRRGSDDGVVQCSSKVLLACRSPVKESPHYDIKYC
jgi:hypothetical protein